MNIALLKIFVFFMIASFTCSDVIATESEQPIQDRIQEQAVENNKTIEVLIPKGTEFKTKLVNEINPDRIKKGDQIQFKLAISYVGNDRILIPQGSTFNGVVINVINRDSSSENVFEILIDISSVTTLFGKEHSLRAHPIIFPDQQHNKKAKWKLFSLKIGNNKDDLLEKRTWATKKNSDSIYSTTNQKPQIIQVDQEIPVVLDQDFKLEIKNRF